MYIRDLDNGISSVINKSVDDTKIDRLISPDSDAIALQADLDKINERTNRWQMHLKISQWKLLFIGRGNPHNCVINNEALVGSEYEKDIGVIASSDIAQRKQCIEAIKKMNRVLIFISEVLNADLIFGTGQTASILSYTILVSILQEG